VGGKHRKPNTNAEREERRAKGKSKDTRITRTANNGTGEDNPQRPIEKSIGRRAQTLDNIPPFLAKRLTPVCQI
jgi:hypothetical protein